MLTLIEYASRKTVPHADAPDRDPGFITLIAALVGAARRAFASTATQARAAHRRAVETELFSSSSAWPHRSR